MIAALIQVGAGRSRENGFGGLRGSRQSPERRRVIALRAPMNGFVVLEFRSAQGGEQSAGMNRIRQSNTSFLCSGSVMDWGHERCNGGIGATATEPCGSRAVGSRISWSMKVQCRTLEEAFPHHGSYGVQSFAAITGTVYCP